MEDPLEVRPVQVAPVQVALVQVVPVQVVPVLRLQPRRPKVQAQAQRAHVQVLRQASPVRPQ